MTIYIYSDETGLQVDAIDCNDNATCEAAAMNKWGDDGYHWSYNDVALSNAV